MFHVQSHVHFSAFSYFKQFLNKIVKLYIKSVWIPSFTNTKKRTMRTWYFFQLFMIFFGYFFLITSAFHSEWVRHEFCMRFRKSEIPIRMSFGSHSKWFSTFRRSEFSFWLAFRHMPAGFLGKALSLNRSISVYSWWYTK